MQERRDTELQAEADQHRKEGLLATAAVRQQLEEGKQAHAEQQREWRKLLVLNQTQLQAARAQVDSLTEQV